MGVGTCQHLVQFLDRADAGDLEGRQAQDGARRAAAGIGERRHVGDARQAQPALGVIGHHLGHAHAALLDAHVHHAAEQLRIDLGKGLGRHILAGLFKFQIAGAVQCLAAVGRFGDPCVKAGAVKRMGLEAHA
jgi:hypothetical protein